MFTACSTSQTLLHNCHYEAPFLKINLLKKNNILQSFSYCKYNFQWVFISFCIHLAMLAVRVYNIDFSGKISDHICHKFSELHLLLLIQHIQGIWFYNSAESKYFIIFFIFKQISHNLPILANKTSYFSTLLSLPIQQFQFQNSIFAYLKQMKANFYSNLPKHILIQNARTSSKQPCMVCVTRVQYSLKNLNTFQTKSG